jgi:hypothetical protein
MKLAATAAFVHTPQPKPQRMSVMVVERSLI